jgi:hypothetical protein
MSNQRAQPGRRLWNRGEQLAGELGAGVGDTTGRL